MAVMAEEAAAGVVSVLLAGAGVAAGAELEAEVGAEEGAMLFLLKVCLPLIQVWEFLAAC